MNKRHRVWLARTNGLPAPKRIETMPSRDQVAFHNDQEMRKRAQEAQLAQQQQAQSQAGNYAYQAALMAQQHGYGQQNQAQALAGQQSLSHQQFGQQKELAVQHVDLQARLNEVQLNQAEQQRMNRMHQARASVEDNPDLSREERNMLITQIESGLNPLENRQREAQMLQSHIQTQGAFQQNQQQAQLFQQRQERLAAGAEGRMRAFTNPNTGESQMFYQSLDGEWHPLDFSGSDQMHQARLESMRASTEATTQGTAQSAELQPGRVTAQALANQGADQAMRYARDTHPLDVERGRLVNQDLTQRIEQSPERFRLDQLQGYAHVAGLQQQLQERIAAQPHNLRLHEANADIAQARAAAEPANTSLAQAAQRATTAHTEAETAHVNATVANMPTVQEARRQHGADSQRAQDTAAIARLSLERLRAGGMPEHAASMLVDHAIGGVNREIGHARAVYDQMARNPATDPAELRRAREHVEQLERGRGAAVQARAAEAEDLVRRVHGMPPANRPAPAQGPQGGFRGPPAPGGQPGAPGMAPFNPNANPAQLNQPQQVAVQGFAALRQRIQQTQMHPQERARMEQSVERMQQLVAANGSREQMPAAARQEYDGLLEWVQRRLWFNSGTR